MSLQDYVSKNITGRIALISRLEADVLERYTAMAGDLTLIRLPEVTSWQKRLTRRRGVR